MQRFLARAFILLISFIFILNISLVEAKTQRHSSKQEIQQLYKQAVRAYREDNLDMAKDLFYKILEINPRHRVANRYIDYEIPKKISRIKIKELKNKGSIPEDQAQTDVKQTEILEEIKEVISKIEEKIQVQEEIKEKTLVKVERKTKKKQQNIKKTRNQISQEIKQRKEQSIQQAKEKKERLRNLKDNERQLKLEKKKEKIEEINNKKTESRELKEQRRQDKLLAKQEKIKDIEQKRAKLKEEKEKRKIAKLEARKTNAQESKIKERESYRKKHLPALEKLHQNSVASEQRGKKVYLDALYDEGFFAHKIGEFDRAKEAFEKILKKDAAEIKARDYLNIYIPKEERKIK